ncbi:MAG TPA: hypothetical protein PLH94_15095 [Fimbriimonadaceae bacterium]|nr:hypothetical protein [Fimbriimonadaceae bacterium]
MTTRSHRKRALTLMGTLLAFGVASAGAELSGERWPDCLFSKRAAPQTFETSPVPPLPLPPMDEAPSNVTVTHNGGKTIITIEFEWSSFVEGSYLEDDAAFQGFEQPWMTKLTDVMGLTSVRARFSGPLHYTPYDPAAGKIEPFL